MVQRTLNDLSTYCTTHHINQGGILVSKHATLIVPDGVGYIQQLLKLESSAHEDNTLSAPKTDAEHMMERAVKFAVHLLDHQHLAFQTVELFGDFAHRGYSAHSTLKLLVNLRVGATHRNAPPRPTVQELEDIGHFQFGLFDLEIQFVEYGWKVKLDELSSQPDDDELREWRSIAREVKLFLPSVKCFV